MDMLSNSLYIGKKILEIPPPVLMKILFSGIGTRSIATYLPAGHRSLLSPSAGPKKFNKSHFHWSS